MFKIKIEKNLYLFMSEEKFMKARVCLFTMNYILIWMFFSFHLDKIVSDIIIDPVFFIIILILISLNIALFMLLVEYILYSLFYIFVEKMYQYNVEKKVKKDQEKIFKNEINLKEDIEMSVINCCICLEQIEMGIKLNCSHIIHKTCLENLMNFKFETCPLCVKPIV